MEYPEPLPRVRCSKCGRKGYDLGGGFGTVVSDPCDAYDHNTLQLCVGLFVADETIQPAQGNNK